MAINKKLKFKGAKRLLFEEELFDFKHVKRVKPKFKNASLKRFWSKVFGDYKMPICPLCGVNMECERVHIERKTTFVSSFGTIPATNPGPPEVEMDFRCPECGSRASGYAVGIEFDFGNDWFSVEEFRVARWEGAVSTNGP